MNIALIVPGGVDRSGEYRVIPALLALIKRLSRNHTVHVFALSQEPQPGEWDLLGARIHNIGRGYTRLRALRAIHAQHRIRPFDVVQSIWSGSGGLIAVTASKLLRVPSLIHVAGGELAAIPDIGYGGGLTWRGHVREALTLRAASVVTAASQPVIGKLATIGVRAQRVPLGVDLETWPARAPVRREGVARLIHVASLNRVKDQPTLLRALAHLADSGVDFHLDVVGEDTLQGCIQNSVMGTPLASRVTFHGFLTQRRLRPFIEAAHVLVMSSRHETGPLVMLEAALVGVPTVSTAVGHATEWAPHAARCVPVGDAPALARATQELLDNEDLRLRVARAAYERAKVENADLTSASFEALYAQCCAQRLAGAQNVRTRAS